MCSMQSVSVYVCVSGLVRCHDVKSDFTDNSKHVGWFREILVTCVTN